MMWPQSEGRNREDKFTPVDRWALENNQLMRKRFSAKTKGLRSIQTYEVDRKESLTIKKKEEGKDWDAWDHLHTGVTQ